MNRYIPSHTRQLLFAVLIILFAFGCNNASTPPPAGAAPAPATDEPAITAPAPATDEPVTTTPAPESVPPAPDPEPAASSAPNDKPKNKAVSPPNGHASTSTGHNDPTPVPAPPPPPPPPPAPSPAPTATADAPSPAPVKRPDPTLAYKYPKTLKQKESGKYIYVNVNVKDVQSVIRDLKSDIVEFKQDDLKKEDTEVIKTVTIKPYRYITVTLQSYSPALKIDSTDGQSATQLIDTVNGNKWKWHVSTDTGTGKVNVVLHVTGYNVEGEAKTVITERNIPMQIKLEMNPMPKMWTWLVDHPQSFLTLLIIPFFKWLGGFIKKKKEGDKEKTA